MEDEHLCSCGAPWCDWSETNWDFGGDEEESNVQDR